MITHDCYCTMIGKFQAKEQSNDKTISAWWEGHCFIRNGYRQVSQSFIFARNYLVGILVIDGASEILSFPSNWQCVWILHLYIATNLWYRHRVLYTSHFSSKVSHSSGIFVYRGSFIVGATLFYRSYAEKLASAAVCHGQKVIRCC